MTLETVDLGNWKSSHCSQGRMLLFLTMLLLRLWVESKVWVEPRMWVESKLWVEKWAGMDGGVKMNQLLWYTATSCDEGIRLTE